MKFSVTTLIISAAALLSTSVNAASCDTLKVAKLYLYSDVIKCTASTGLVPGTTPSAEVLARVCGNLDCTAAIASIRALDLGDCTISGVALESQFLTPIQEYCGGTMMTTALPSSSSAGASSVTATSEASAIATGATVATLVFVAAVVGTGFA